MHNCQPYAMSKYLNRIIQHVTIAYSKDPCGGLVCWLGESSLWAGSPYRSPHLCVLLDHENRNCNSLMLYNPGTRNGRAQIERLRRRHIQFAQRCLGTRFETDSL